MTVSQKPFLWQTNAPLPSFAPIYLLFQPHLASLHGAGWHCLPGLFNFLKCHSEFYIIHCTAGSSVRGFNLRLMNGSHPLAAVSASILCSSLISCPNISPVVADSGWNGGRSYFIITLIRATRTHQDKSDGRWLDSNTAIREAFLSLSWNHFIHFTFIYLLCLSMTHSQSDAVVVFRVAVWTVSQSTFTVCIR